MKHYTSIEQSKKFLELGLNSETADMYYGYHKEKPELLPHSDTDVKALCIPCWSVGALLELMPFPILWMECLAGMILWKCSATTIEEGKIHEVTRESILDAVYNMVVLLLENGYLKKEE